MINASMSVCQVTFFGPHELPALHPSSHTMKSVMMVVGMVAILILDRAHLAAVDVAAVLLALLLGGVVALLLGHILALLLGLVVTFLPGNFDALGPGVVSALLARNVFALFPGHTDTGLLGHTGAHLARCLGTIFLRH